MWFCFQINSGHAHKIEPGRKARPEEWPSVLFTPKTNETHMKRCFIRDPTRIYIGSGCVRCGLRVKGWWVDHSLEVGADFGLVFVLASGPPHLFCDLFFQINLLYIFECFFFKAMSHEKLFI